MIALHPGNPENRTAPATAPDETVPSSIQGGDVMAGTPHLIGAMKSMEVLLGEVAACRACADILPHGPRPVLQVHPAATILIASQAPGSRVHRTGVPFDDPSGERLRAWAGIPGEVFYDEQKVAILPMAFCYPGRSASGDAPPPARCARLWRRRLLAQLPSLRLTLLVGTYAQDHVLGRGRMTQRVRDFAEYLPGIFPLPHPSWRSRIWESRNPWFEREVIPALRAAVAGALGERGKLS